MKAPLVLLGVFLGTFLGAQGWDQGRGFLPPTAAARTAAASVALVAKTPVERLKAGTFDLDGVRVTSTLVRPGVGENLLWEFRWEPGAAWGPGTWVAFRDGLGRLRELRIILLEGSDGSDHRLAQTGTWVRLVPQSRGTRLDLFLAGRLVSGGWTVPGTLLDLVASPDTWVWDVTAEHLDWSALIPHRRWEDEKVETLVATLRKTLSTIPEAPTTLWWPDPRSGRAATTATGAPWGAWTPMPGRTGDRGLGPWGVTHWVTLGVLRGWKGSDPTMESLLVPRIELPGYSRALVPEDLLGDPAFALDWIRNLALAVRSQLYPHRPVTDDAADAREVTLLEAIPGTGYAVEDFPALAHLLAVSQPGRVYLASFSTQVAGALGASAAVEFREPAVVLPWVGSDDRVRVSVFAGPQELTWAQWLQKFPQGRRGVRPDHIALTVLPLPAAVDMPLLPLR